ncbi:hypothetical protein V2W45_1475024 [Cenococcum geophilum]
MLLVAYTCTRRAKDLTECLIFNKPIKRARYIAIYRKGDTSKIPLRKEEGELLRKVMGKEVVNVARYYYYEIVYIGGKEDNIYKNVYKGLNIIRAINYKLEDLIMPLRPAGVKISIRKGRSSSRNRSFSRKRSSSYTNALLPPSKQGSIKGYESLYTWAGIIQYNILIGNLIINKEDNNLF